MVDAIDLEEGITLVYCILAMWLDRKFECSAGYEYFWSCRPSMFLGKVMV